MRRFRSGVAVAVLVLAAAACGGDDDAADIFGDVDDAGGGDGAVVADDSDPGGDGGGSGELDRDPSAASGETEGGIPYPAEGLDVLADAGVEIAGQRQLHYPVDRFDELVAFYDDYVDGLGGQSGRAEVAGAVSWQVFADDGTLSLITVEPEFETRLGGEPITVTFVLLVDG